MKIRGHAVRYPPLYNSLVAQVYGMLLDDGHVDSRLLGQVVDACPTLEDKVNLLAAILLQPPTDQQREWIEAIGSAWVWSSKLHRDDEHLAQLHEGTPT
jgi:hypothetical protein